MFFPENVALAVSPGKILYQVRSREINLWQSFLKVGSIIMIFQEPGIFVLGKHLEQFLALRNCRSIMQVLEFISNQKNVLSGDGCFLELLYFLEAS